MIGLSVTAFGIAWWLGLYVLARDPRKSVLRRAGLGLLAYAMALVVDQLGTSWLLNIGFVLTCLPALAWSGVFVLLGDESRGLDRWWRFGVVPLFTLVAAAVVVGVQSAELVLTGIGAVGLSGGLVLLLRRWPLVRRPRREWLGPLLIGSLMAALVTWLVLLAFGVLPR